MSTLQFLAVYVAVISVLAVGLILALIWEETARRRWRDDDRYCRQWIAEHTAPTDFAPYDGDEVERR